MLTAAAVSACAGEALAEGWVPRPDIYTSEAEAREEFARHVQSGDNITELVERMRPLAAEVITSENLRVSYNPLLWGVDLTAVYFHVDVGPPTADGGRGNYDSWRYLFQHRNGRLSAWEIQRHYFGPNFAARAIPLRLEDFERTERGWEAARDAILQQIGEPITIDRVQQVMTTLDMDRSSYHSGRAGTFREGWIQILFSKNFPREDSLQATITENNPFFSIDFLFDPSGNISSITGQHQDS